MKTNLLEWLSEALLTITTIPMIAMMVHVTLDVVLKYTINTPIQGTLEITAYYYMVSVVVLPMALVELTRQSIAVDLFYQMMPYPMQVAVTVFVLLICIAGYGGLAWITWPDAFIALERREIVMGTINIFIWPARFLLPIALTMTTLVCLMLLYRVLFRPERRDEIVSIHAIDPDLGVD